MDDITLERLLNNFTEVLQEINEIVERKDINAARRALEQIEELVNNDTHITLDDREDSNMDHVLHDLLSRINGVIEISEEINGSEISEEFTRLTTRRTEITERITEIDAEIIEIQNQAIDTTDVKSIEARITYLRNEIDSIRSNTFSNSRDDAINTEMINRLNQEITELEARLNNRSNEENIEGLRNQLADLEERRQRAVRARQEATSDQEIAIADSDRIDLTRQIRDIQSRISAIENRENRISEIDSEIQSNETEINRLREQLNEIGTQNPVNPANQARIDEINRTIESRSRLVQELNRDLQTADRDSDVWANAFAQRRRLNDEIAELRAELNELTNTDNKSRNDNEEEPTVLFEGVIAEGMETPEIQFERATGIKFDSEKHEIRWSGADGEQYTDEPATPFIVVEKKIKEENNREDNNQKRNEINNKIKELQEKNEALRKEKEELQSNKNKSNKNNRDYKSDEEIRAEIETKRKKIAELEANKGKNIDITVTEEYKKLISEIAILEAELISKRAISAVLTDEQKARIDILIKERKTLIEEQEKLTVRIKEITPGKKVSDRLDLGEEASRIGDKIFKTAQIRKELSERNITREEFLEFYTKGRDGAQNVLEELNKQFTELQEEVGAIISDPESETSLINQAADAEVSGKDKETIKLYEQIRSNFVKSGKYKGDLKKVGFIDTEITTKEQAEKFKTEFVEKYMEYIENKLQGLKSQMDEQKENIEIFNKEIQIIKDEQKAINESKTEMSKIESNTKEEKALREKQIRATIFGDEELETEWNERVKRFHSHRKTADNKAVYRDSEGNLQEVEYETIEEYPEYADDKFFLNINDYKKYLELTSIYKNSGNDLNSVLGRLDPEILKTYQSMEEEQKGAGEKWLQQYIGEQAEYVSSFHGFTNEHGVKYSTLKTAGSTLKAMKPVRGDLPATTKVGNAVSNVFRFLGIRKPEFTRINEKGEKVSNIAGGLLTLATDAAVIGGATAATIVGGPLALAGTYGVAYAAKGVVTAGNVIASRRELRKHGDEIRANLPTLGHPSKDDKEVARKDYYRTVEGKSRFGAWLKAKNDKNFSIFKKRALATEEAIAQKRIAESNATIDVRTAEAIKRIKNNEILAERNQQVRQENTRTVVRNQNTYNDIVRDPDAVNLDSAIAQSARNAALEMNGKKGQDVNPNSKVERTDKYVKESKKLLRTQNIEDSKLKGDSVAATAITIEEKYTAKQQKQDRINRVLTAILTVAGRVGFDAITTKLMKENTVTQKDPDKVTPDQTTPDQVIPGKTVTKQVKSYDYDPNKPISDFKISDEARMDTYGASSYIPPKNVIQKGSSIDGIAITHKGPNGTGSVSVGNGTIGYNWDDSHVLKTIDGSMTNWSPKQIMEFFKKEMPDAYEGLLKSAGKNPSNVNPTEFFLEEMKNGNVWVQNKMNGWQQVEAPEEIIKTVTTKLPDTIIPGKTIPGSVVPGATHTVTTTTFDPLLILDSELKGSMVGVGVGVGEGLHEAAKQTKRVDPGNFEQNNPNLPISKKYKLAMALIEKSQQIEKEKREQEQSKNTKGQEQQNKNEKKSDEKNDDAR